MMQLVEEGKLFQLASPIRRKDEFPFLLLLLPKINAREHDT